MPISLTPFQLSNAFATRRQQRTPPTDAGTSAAASGAPGWPLGLEGMSDLLDLRRTPALTDQTSPMADDPLRRTAALAGEAAEKELRRAQLTVQGWGGLAAEVAGRLNEATRPLSSGGAAVPPAATQGHTVVKEFNANHHTVRLLSDGQIELRDPFGSTTFRVPIKPEDVAWVDGRLWCIGNAGVLSVAAVAGEDGCRTTEPADLPLEGLRPLRFEQDGVNLRLVAQHPNPWVENAVPLRLDRTGRWQMAHRPAPRFEPETIGTSVGWMVEPDPVSGALICRSAKSGAERPVNVKGAFRNVQGLPFRDGFMALQRLEGNHWGGGQSQLVVGSLKDERQQRLTREDTEALALPGPAPVTCKPVGPTRPYACVTSFQKGYCAVLRDGTVLTLDADGRQVGSLPDLPDDGRQAQRALRADEPSTSQAGGMARRVRAEIVGCMLNGRETLVVRTAGQAPRESKLWRYDAEGNRWERLVQAASARVGDRVDDRDVLHIEPSSKHELVVRSREASGTVQRRVAMTPGKNASDPVRLVPQAHAESPMTQAAKASGKRFWVGGKRIEGGFTVGSTNLVSTTSDLVQSAKVAITSPLRLTSDIAKAIGQGVRGRRGLQQLGFYDQVNRATGHLRHQLLQRGGAVGWDGLGARLDDLANRQPQLAEAMRAEEQAILKDLGKTLKSIACEMDWPESGHPQAHPEKTRGVKPRGDDVIAKLRARMDTYALTRKDSSSVPPELDALCTLLARLESGDTPRHLAFPDPKRPRATQDGVGLLLGRIGLDLQRLDELHGLAGRADTAGLDRARNHWAKQPIYQYTDAGQFSVRDVEGFYGTMKALRKALTDTRSPFYKAIAGMEGACNPGELRDKLYQHIRSMNSLELLRFSRTLSAGVSGAVGLFGTVLFIDFGLGGQHARTFEIKGNGDGNSRWILTTSRGETRKIAATFRALPLPTPARVDFTPLGVSYANLKGRGGLHAMVPSGKVADLLRDLMTPEQEGPMDPLRLLQHCSLAERASYSERSLQLGTSFVAGATVLDTFKGGNVGERIVLGLSGLYKLREWKEQWMRYTNAQRDEPEQTEEYQKKDGRGGFYAHLGAARTTSGWQENFGLVQPQGTAGITPLGVVAEHPNERNDKMQSRWGVPAAPTQAQCEPLFDAARLLFPGAASKVEELRARLANDQVGALRDLRQLAGNLENECPVDSAEGARGLARTEFLDAVELLSLQCELHDKQRAVPTGTRLEPRATSLKKLLDSHPKQGANAPAISRLHQWAAEHANLRQLLQVAQGAKATRYKLRLAMTPQDQLKYHRLLAQDPPPSRKEVDAFLADHRNHGRIDKLILLSADEKGIGGEVSLPIAFGDYSRAAEEASLGELTFLYNDGENEPFGYKADARLAHLVESRPATTSRPAV